MRRLSGYGLDRCKKLNHCRSIQTSTARRINIHSHPENPLPGIFRAPQSHHDDMSRISILMVLV
jgi:hypothetical protein